MVANHPSKESQGLQMKLTGKPIPAMNCRQNTSLGEGNFPGLRLKS